MGVAAQFTTDDKGNGSIKRHTIHDASFPPPSEKLINSRLDKDTLEPCFYGFCLLRLHLIHKIRHLNPQTAILIMKIDLDSAYRRFHVLIRIVLLAIIIIIKQIAYILMRLPFGVANGPD